MTDYGREVRFGYFLIPNAADPLLATAQEVERLGLDYIGVQDHPYQRRYVDTWTLLAMIAATTARVRVFPDVANLPLRPPAVLAKAAASLDRLSGGRFELGLGAGGFWDAIAAYGGPRRSLAEAFRALAEAIEVIRMVWSGERNLRFQGEFYRLAGAHSGPVPDRRIGIWLGVYGPKALRLAGRVADGWVPSFRGQLQSLREMTGNGPAEGGRGRRGSLEVWSERHRQRRRNRGGALRGAFVAWWTNGPKSWAGGGGGWLRHLCALGPGPAPRRWPPGRWSSPPPARGPGGGPGGGAP